MAFSRVSRVAAAIACAVLSGRAQSADLLSSKLPLTVDAASSEVDYRANTIVLRDVTLSQGDVTVTAQRCEAVGGLNADDSRWTLTGDVKMRIEQRGNLSSDRAVVTFKNKRIETAVATGSPARFEQNETATGRVAQGHAREIEYAVNKGTVRLSQDAWVSSQGREITGPLLVYDIRAQHLEAESTPESGQRVHIRIDPSAEKRPGSPQ